MIDARAALTASPDRPGEIVRLRVVEWTLLPTDYFHRRPAAFTPGLVCLLGALPDAGQDGVRIQVAVVIFHVPVRGKAEDDEP